MIPRRATLRLAAALAVMTAAGCAPRAITARSAQSDGVMFAYSLAPTATPSHYQVSLALRDSRSGQAIDDAGVALGLNGPGLASDDLVNLRHDRSAGAPVYVGEIVMPVRANYRLTFQVNRPAPAASAQVVFSTPRPPG